MTTHVRPTVLAFIASTFVFADAAAQHGGHGTDMLMLKLGDLTLMTMAQAFPYLTASSVAEPMQGAGAYLTQPAIMMNVATRNDRLVLRTTLNFEGITQPGGELTFGGWGEGFIDKRHPHTLVHEFVLSYNRGTAARGFSVSAGKGFAPYGTDDPMSRPVLKYPTNHHLSQVLERFFISGVAGVRSWGVEGSVFGGNEPTGPYDFGNIEPFGNSWSARVTKRFGAGMMGTWPWELAASHAYITEEHEGEARHTRLFNVSVRHERPSHYTLVEASRSDSDHDRAYFSVLGEGARRLGVHRPYARLELATRPEWTRLGAPDSDEWFRYDHDAEPTGASRWLIATLGYGAALGRVTFSPRPFVEAQYQRVRREHGVVDSFVRSNAFWSISAGVRIFFGGEPMRMGTYGVLDPMRGMHEQPPAPAAHHR